MIDENTSRQVEELYRSDDWAELRWAREHSTPQQIARHLLDPQWRNRDYNALDELVEMTHDADLSSLDEDDLETLAASGLPELRQAIIRYAGTPARLLEDMARTESNTRLLQMLVESGKLSQNAIDLCCWNQTDSRLAASMLTKASDDLLHRLSGRDWWPSRKNAVESGRLDRKDLDDMIKTENHPDVVSALIGTDEFDMDSEAEAIRRVITSPGLLTAYTNPMNRRYSLDQSRREVVRQAARTMLEHAPVGMILSMPDDDDENWRTLIDTAATEYAGELGKDMLGLIAQSEGNTQARTILAGRGFPKAAASNAERTLAASPGADGTYGFNLRLLGRLKDDVDYFLGPSHAEKYLWAGSVDAQIAKLREIDGTIRPEDRPEWFTTEWIDQAEREMKDPSDNTETALDAALSGQYAAFENAVMATSTRTTRTREPARTARASSPDTRWPHATRTERPWPTGSTGSTMKAWSTRGRRPRKRNSGVSAKASSTVRTHGTPSTRRRTRPIRPPPILPERPARSPDMRRATVRRSSSRHWPADMACRKERWNCCPTTPPDRSRTSSTPEEPVEDGRNGQPDKTGNDAVRTSTDCWTYCPSPWSRKTETTR